MNQGLPAQQQAAPQQAAPQPQGQAPQLDITKLNIPALLMEKLHINEEQLAALMELLSQAKTPQEAIQTIKRFDLNPETMNDPVPGEQPAPAPQRGMPV